MISIHTSQIETNNIIIEFDKERYSNKIVEELKNQSEIYEDDILDECISIIDRWSSVHLLGMLEAECIEKLENMGIKIEY